jgi:hypothetical protein
MYDKTNGENIEIRYNSWFNNRYGTPECNNGFLIHFPWPGKLKRMKKFISRRIKFS